MAGWLAGRVAGRLEPPPPPPHPLPPTDWNTPRENNTELVDVVLCKRYHKECTGVALNFHELRVHETCHNT